MLKYCLTPNPNPKDKKNFIASVACNKSIKLENFIDDMTDEGTGLTRPQAMAYFEKLIQLTERYVRQGNFINTPLFRLRASITGTFESKSEKFDPKKHKINIRCTPGSRINKINKITELRKFTPTQNHPEIYELFDSVTKQTNSTITPGTVAILKGKHLKFDICNQHHGLFFVSETNTKLQTRASIYAGNKPSELYVLIPALSPGTYKVNFKSSDPQTDKIITATLEKCITI